MKTEKSEAPHANVGGDEEGIIARIERVQATYGYLPQDKLKMIAEETGRSLVDIYGVATFYKAFSLKPRGKHLISVCLGTACHVHGGPRIAETFQQELGIRSGETTPDREFSLETVNCLGACALGPVAVADGHYFSKVRTSQVKDIIQKTKKGLDLIEVETDARVFPVEVSCARCNHSLMDPRHVLDGRPAIRVTVSFGTKHGWLALSSLYGSFRVVSEYAIPADEIVHMFCPHCHAELIGGGKCSECGAHMVPMIVRGGGVVQICARRGCRGHMLDTGGVPLG
ncbi:MAG: NAD(P)H-dependent oxidoreductase subunit E [Chitinivibrionia bacterium]|nr:NAD(P)H-dependent oxidoreductase subunit E [Chitinivibrionia bacterium]